MSRNLRSSTKADPEPKDYQHDLEDPDFEPSSDSELPQASDLAMVNMGDSSPTTPYVPIPTSRSRGSNRLLWRAPVAPTPTEPLVGAYVDITFFPYLDEAHPLTDYRCGDTPHKAFDKNQIKFSPKHDPMTDWVAFSREAAQFVSNLRGVQLSANQLASLLTDNITNPEARAQVHAVEATLAWDFFQSSWYKLEQRSRDFRIDEASPMATIRDYAKRIKLLAHCCQRPDLSLMYILYHFPPFFQEDVRKTFRSSFNRAGLVIETDETIIEEIMDYLTDLGDRYEDKLTPTKAITPRLAYPKQKDAANSPHPWLKALKEIPAHTFHENIRKGWANVPNVPQRTFNTSYKDPSTWTALRSILTSDEAQYRRENSLCRTCGNHSNKTTHENDLGNRYLTSLIYPSKNVTDITTAASAVTTENLTEYSYPLCPVTPIQDSDMDLMEDDEDLTALSCASYPVEILTPNTTWARTTASVDTYCAKNIIMSSLASRLSLPVHYAPHPIRLKPKYFTNKTLCDKIVILKLKINDTTVRTKAYIVDGDPDELILGLEFLIPNRAILSFDGTSDTSLEVSPPLHTVIPDSLQATTALTNPEREDPDPLPQEEEPESLPQEEEEPEPLPQKEEEPVYQLDTLVSAATTSSDDILNIPEWIDPDRPAFRDDNPPKLEPIVDGVNYCVKVRLKDEWNPSYPKVIPIPLAQRDQFKSQLESMVASGELSPSPTTFLSRVFSIKKPGTEKFRFVTDLSDLNKHITLENIDLPKINDVLAHLGSFQHFSVLDIRDAFHQLIVEPSSRKFFGILTQFGTYTYNVAPQGFANSPAHWQRYLRAILQQHSESTSIYLDDVIIHTSGSESDHIETVKDIIACLESRNLRLSPKKCKFLAKEFDFLGHHISISEGGANITTTDLHREDLRKIITPTTRRGLQRVLGLLNWFRDYVPDYARSTTLLQNRLTALLRDGVYRFVMTKEEQQELNDLIAFLTSDIFISSLDPKLPVILQTDASSVGVGGILFQEPPKSPIRVVGYYSHRNSPAETRYKPYDLELLAIVRSCEHFRHLLLGRHFTVRTDHAALLNLKSRCPEDLKHFGWLTRLSPFNIRVEHIPGTENSVADTLSRQWPHPKAPNSPPFITDKDSFSTTSAATTTNTIGRTSTRLLQPDLYNIWKDLTVSDLHSAPVSSTSGLPEPLHARLLDAYATSNLLAWVRY